MYVGTCPTGGYKSHHHTQTHTTTKKGWSSTFRLITQWHLDFPFPIKFHSLLRSRPPGPRASSIPRMAVTNDACFFFCVATLLFVSGTGHAFGSQRHRPAAPRNFLYFHVSPRASSFDGGEDGTPNNVAPTSKDVSAPVDYMPTDIPSTPCVRICRYNANFFAGQICIGCYRDEYEISSWAMSSAQEKSWALLDAADRVPEGCDANQNVVKSEGGEDTTSNTCSCDFTGAISKDELLRQAKYWENAG